MWQSLDIGGPDVVTYGELIDRIREQMLVDRPTLELRTLAAHADRQPHLLGDRRRGSELIGPLMESLERISCLADDRAAELLGVRLHSLDAAIEHALREWEADRAAGRQR